MALPSRNPYQSVPSYSDLPDTNVRRRDSLPSVPADEQFVSQADVDRWVRDRTVSVCGSIIVVAGSGQRLVMRDAVRVLGPRSEADVYGMTGRVMTIGEILGFGAALTSSSMRIGRTEYDAQYGYVLQALCAA